MKISSRKQLRSVIFVVIIGGILLAEEASSDPAVGVRLERAQRMVRAQQEKLSALEKDLAVFTNFDWNGLLFLGSDKPTRLNLTKNHYREGKFGKGCYFERPRHNMLSPNVADVERDVNGFQTESGAHLRSAPTDTRFGKRALLASLPSAGAAVKTVPVEIRFTRQYGHEKVVTLLASCYVRGPKDTAVTLDLNLVKKDWSAPEDKPKRIPDQVHSQNLTLTGTWQRVACHAEADARLKERKAVLRLASASAEPVEIFLDGFQFEQCNYYPHAHLTPSTWMPGETKVDASFLTLPDELIRKAFPIQEGTISFWTRTPHVSNLTKEGNTCWLNFGVWWHDPLWALGTYRFHAGAGEFCYFKNTNVTDGKWHHVAMTWDRTEGRAYRDGELHAAFKREEKDISRRLGLYRLRLGGSVTSGQAANAIMDEVAVFRRKLTEEEIRNLASGQVKLNPASTRLAISPVARSVFYRDETRATLDFDLRTPEDRDAKIMLDCAIGDVSFHSTRVVLKKGRTVARFPFSPAELKCGTYMCRVGVADESHLAYREILIHVVPALRPDHYMLSSWGRGCMTPEWRVLFKRLGLNTVDTDDTNVEVLGREGFMYGWHYRFGDGVWSPKNRKAVKERTEQEARWRAQHPNWRYTLLNSEKPSWLLPPEEERRAWFDQWAEKELGFPIPEKGWRFGTSHNATMCWLPDGDASAEDGVYRPPQAFEFLKWWYNRGNGWWRLNGEAAKAIRELRPDVKLWTDPLRYPGQIADLDAGSTWSYHIRPEPFVGTFESACAINRGSGKEFYSTLGMNYVRGREWMTVTKPDGVKKILMPTPDDMIQQAWIVVAGMPTDGLTYWDLDGMFYGQRGEKERYMPPGSDEKLGKVFREDLFPLGTMLKGVPSARRPVALLLPESTLWMDAGEGKWGWGTAHYPNDWMRWLGEANIQYDMIKDNNITGGSLSRYKVIIFPMAAYVAEKVYQELVAAGRQGTGIIVDRYCRQQYPDMEQWEQGYFHRMPTKERTDYGRITKTSLTALWKELRPELYAFAEGEEGKVLTFVREYNGVRYVAVINDARQKGPYTEWTGKKDFQPYGRAQQARVYLKIPRGSAVYEFTESRRIRLAFEGGRAVVPVHLPPHAGRVLCVYPAPLAKLRIAVLRRYKRGKCFALRVTLQDANRQVVKGRQLLDVSIIDSERKKHDESGLYRMENGRTEVPFRPAVNDRAGRWSIRVCERTSGLTATARLFVK